MELARLVRISTKVNLDAVPYNKNHPRKKSFVNFANLEALASVFCTFYLGRNFYIMRLPELQKFSRELQQRRQFANFSSMNDSHYMVYILMLTYLVLGSDQGKEILPQ